MSGALALAACPLCGLIQDPGRVLPGQGAFCPRCGAEVTRVKPDPARRTLAMALGALIMYGPANVFPLVTVYYQGRVVNATLWSSVQSLWEQGHYGVGCMLFTTSVATPAIKVVCLLFLSLAPRGARWLPAQRRVFQLLELINPWNMLEIFLIALVVAIVKFGEVATIEPGPGALAFVTLVALTILAYQCFDARLLWEPEAAA